MGRQAARRRSCQGHRRPTAERRRGLRPARDAPGLAGRHRDRFVTPADDLQHVAGAPGRHTAEPHQPPDSAQGGGARRGKLRERRDLRRAPQCLQRGGLAASRRDVPGHRYRPIADHSDVDWRPDGTPWMAGPAARARRQHSRRHCVEPIWRRGISSDAAPRDRCASPELSRLNPHVGHARQRSSAVRVRAIPARRLAGLLPEVPGPVCQPARAGAAHGASPPRSVRRS